MNKDYTQLEFEIKNSAVDLTEMALGVVVLGIIVAIGANVLSNMANSRVTSLPTFNVINESITPNNGSADQLNSVYFKQTTSVINASSGNTIDAGNYTITVNDMGLATFKLTAGVPWNNTLLKINYVVYNESDPQYAVPTKAATGLLEYGNWFNILVIVGIASVILALIFIGFGGAGKGGGGAGIGSGSGAGY